MRPHLSFRVRATSSAKGIGLAAGSFKRLSVRYPDGTTAYVARCEPAPSPAQRTQLWGVPTAQPPARSTTTSPSRPDGGGGGSPISPLSATALPRRLDNVPGTPDRGRGHRPRTGLDRPRPALQRKSALSR